MNILPVKTTAAAEPAPAASKDTVNYDAFLKLLIATLKSQDPTEPSDPGQMLSQLASFSVVEQSIQTNEKLDSLLSFSTGAGAGSLIGKFIESGDGASKGVIASVEITSTGLTALTVDGLRIPVEAGAKVSSP